MVEVRLKVTLQVKSENTIKIKVKIKLKSHSKANGKWPFIQEFIANWIKKRNYISIASFFLN